MPCIGQADRSGYGSIAVRFKALEAFVSCVAVPFAGHDRTEANAVAVSGTALDGTGMRAVAPKRQVRDGFGRFLQKDPVRDLAGSQTENVRIRPPRRTDHCALYRRKYRINKPAFSGRPGTSKSTSWRQRRDGITPHVLVVRKRVVQDGVRLGRRIRLHWAAHRARLHTDGVRDVRPRVALSGRSVLDGRLGIDDKAKYRTPDQIM